MFSAAIRSTARAAPLRSTRALHATPAAYKTMAESVADVADTVNKKVGKGLASAIETGEQATEKAASTVGVAKEKSKEGAEIAGQKANQAQAGAKQGAEDFKKEVKK